MNIEELNVRKTQMIKRHETSSFSPEFRGFFEWSVGKSETTDQLDIVSEDITNFRMSNYSLKETSIIWMKEITSDYENIFKLDFTVRGLDVSEKYVREKFEIFIKVLSKDVYGRAYKRYKKRMKYYSLLEGNENKRFHIHSVINKPDHISDKEFISLVKDISHRISGFSIIERLNHQSSGGWFEYMNKLSSKSSGNFSDNIIIE